MAVDGNWVLFHLDVKTTFLTGDPREVVWMGIPEGFVVQLIIFIEFADSLDPSRWAQAIPTILV